MAGTKAEALAKLAGDQHWLVSRRQLLDLGFTPRAIEHRLAVGRLHRVFRGVYAVGVPEMSDHRRWMAAVLGSGGEAALSHRSAAALWGIAGERGGIVHVTVRRLDGPRRPHLRTVCRPALGESEITARDQIPVTVLVRTLLDLGTEVGELELERAINEADKLDLIDPENLRSALEDHRGERGVRRVRAILDRDTFRLSDSALEILFRDIATEAGLPLPRTKEPVNGFEVDFYWPELGLVVETDGLRYHRTPAALARDQARDQTHVAAGLTTLRFSHWQVKHRRASVRQTLEKTAAHLSTKRRRFGD